jgi:hypothetical protein
MRKLRSLSVFMSGLTIISLSAKAQQTTALNEWTWMGGSSTVGSNGGQPGVYGTLGTPAPGNIPGGREYAMGWTDSSGNFWVSVRSSHLDWMRVCNRCPLVFKRTPVEWV